MSFSVIEMKRKTMESEKFTYFKKIVFIGKGIKIKVNVYFSLIASR